MIERITTLATGSVYNFVAFSDQILLVLPLESKEFHFIENTNCECRFWVLHESNISCTLRYCIYVPSNVSLGDLCNSKILYDVLSL